MRAWFPLHPSCTRSQLSVHEDNKSKLTRRQLRNSRCCSMLPQVKRRGLRDYGSNLKTSISATTRETSCLTGLLSLHVLYFCAEKCSRLVPRPSFHHPCGGRCPSPCRSGRFLLAQGMERPTCVERSWPNDLPTIRRGRALHLGMPVPKSVGKRVASPLNEHLWCPSSHSCGHLSSNQVLQSSAIGHRMLETPAVGPLLHLHCTELDAALCMAHGIAAGLQPANESGLLQ